MYKQKRVLAIHDISCVGKCSLTVALPIISAAGVECSVLPTAVLSTHTGGFKDYTFNDLSNDLLPICRHWKSLGLHFDAIYTGFLAGPEQVDTICEIIDMLAGKDTVVAVDPVMGDNGRLYSSFKDNFPKKMIELCKKADIITPNLTEACMMLGEKYTEGLSENKEAVEGILAALCENMRSDVVLTGVQRNVSLLGAAWRTVNGEKGVYCSRRIDGMYHGTGDVFASLLVACMIRGIPLPCAVETAVDFTEEAVRATKEMGTDPRYGVDFESLLADFALTVKKLCESFK